MTITERIALKEKLWLSGEFRGDQIDEILRRMENGHTFDSAAQTVIREEKTV